MRVQVTEDGMVVMSFDLSNYEMARKVIKYAICEYEAKGFDASPLQTILILLEETHTTLQ